MSLLSPNSFKGLRNSKVYVVFKRMLFVVAFSLSASLQAQGTDVDSLKVLLTKAKTDNEKADLYWSLGKAYEDTYNQYDSSYFYIEKAHEIVKETLDPEISGKVYAAYAHLYLKLDDYDKAVSNFSKAIEQYEQLGNLERQSVFNSNLASSYFYKKDYEKAKEHYQIAIDLSKEIADSVGILIDHSNLAQTEMKLEGGMPIAKAYFEFARGLSKRLEYEIPPIYVSYGKILYEEGDVEEAKKEVLFGLEVAKDVRDFSEITEALDLLYKIELESQNYEEAIRMFDLKSQYKDSINETKNAMAIENLKLSFTIKEQREKLQSLSQERSYQTIIYILGGLGVLLMIVLVFRQRKIDSITKKIHNIQRRLIDQDLGKKKD
ncbi:tetratricopeptide repeat protein [Aureisphaera galaxeae]|uniref:tetratricopeptide repeat protein n=1 Tax=Aureisphaera galaxeae TaxID=1538023 RepID=UPI00234FF2F7|nr:tetratricopeptide repeat protein [Aureisphaera galaxeae]MDC8002811.1 tetratricopeptide repeat protein [Aureisphaera galaxeae]